MKSNRGNLQPAHKGYRYQDIATAYVLVRSLVDGYNEVVVDRKQVEDDRIDDLEVRTRSGRVRRQFKSSENLHRCLAADDFILSNSSLRIDRLVLTHVRGSSGVDTEYRLCATWGTPASDDSLIAMLEPVTAPPTLLGSTPQLYRLRGELIWPNGKSPRWRALLTYTHPDAEFGRPEFLAFCERFIIELALPIASTDLNQPGPLECLLTNVLADEVGIGRYPNQGRVAADVAALAISLANLARTQAASLTPAEVEHALEIRTDFGRVAQAFPLDESLFHDRPEFRRSLRERALAGTRQLVIAPPGAGKSWELTRLADELRHAGAIVARHYCYLEPGDDLVERRVTTDVFFGNLLSELLDDAPELIGAGGARYAAGFQELEEALEKGSAAGRSIVLIIDGLDHIARVRAEANSLSDDDTDIVERLATLNIPDGVAVVIGSQPGTHLDPLRANWATMLVEQQLPVWRPADLAALIARHGVAGALAAIGITGSEEIAHIYSDSTLAIFAAGRRPRT